MTGTAIVEAEPDVLRALRSLGGTGTIGDVVSAAGLHRDTVEGALKELLESRRGHLEVSDSGELIYRFDPSLIRRDAVPLVKRVGRAVGRFLTKAFKVWITVTFVVYFVLFVALVIAALVAMLSRGDGRRGGWGRGGRGGGIGRIPAADFWLWYYIWTPRWRLGRPNYGRRWERTLPREERPPFYKKVFAFVFGPDRPEPTRKQLDRGTLRLIRARRGVLTAAELVQHTALPLPEAEEEMARLLGSYAGEPTVTSDGELVYAFPEMMVSAHGRVSVREPDPAWLRMEYPLELTGNDKKTDTVIASMAVFNLLAGATAPWFLFPPLGIGGTAAMIGLVLVPLIFSVLFLGIPLVRRVGVKRENRARLARNVRRAVLSLVYSEALAEGDAVTLADAVAHVQRKLKGQPIEPSTVEQALHQLAAEFDADVVSLADGALGFRFPAIRRQFVASEATRRQLRLEERTLGPTIYSSADTPAEAAARDLEAFDRQLADHDVDISGYLSAPGRVGFEADHEVVAFEEELARERPTRA